MKRSILSAIIVGLLAAPPAHSASAGAYPYKPIRMVVPFSAGGFSDIIARIFGQALSERIGQPVVIDNRPGASGMLGTDIVVRAAPDGYTLLLNSFNHVVNPSLLKMPYDPIKSFTSVSLIAEGPALVMMVNPKGPVKTVKDLIELAKARPGKLNYGSSGVGTSGHLIGELFKMVTGTNMVHVPYRGSGASMTAVISGEVTMVSAYLSVALPMVRSGRLRALAVTSAHRSPLLPNVPTMSEAGVPGIVVTGFAGMLAPAHTPRPIVDYLHGEIVKLAHDPTFAKHLASYDMHPVADTPQAFEKYTREQIAEWAKVIKTAGIRVKQN